MSLTVLLVDSSAPYARDGVASGLLTLPLAEGTVLDAHLAVLEGLVEKDVWITFPGGCTPEYERQVLAGARRDLKVLAENQLADALARAEPSDRLLVVQARHWLLEGCDVPQLKRTLRQYRGAVFAVPIGQDADAARERVEMDPQGRVRRVQRLYTSVSWPDTAASRVALGIIPTRAAADVGIRSVADLRFALAARGVLSTDLPLHCDTLDLSVESEFLALSERFTESVARQSPPPGGFEQRGPGVLVAEGCRIDPSARLIAPVIVQSGAEIQESATVIGPALLGRGSRVGARATIAQAVVLPETLVSPAATVRHCVWPALDAASSAAAYAAALAFAAQDPVLGPRWMAFHPADAQGGSVIQGKWLHLAAKRGLDVICAGLALLVLSPVLLLVALGIKIDSRGPVFFSHRRERKGGKEFPCIKFRTMVQNAHAVQRELYRNNELDGPQFKMRNDPRVTRIGGWLRGTNLDELPQLINVLLGHMSLVGPRPSPFRENQICVPWRRARLSVRPGITGLWQICRDETREADFHQWIYYDVAYVRHFSFWLDLKILLATVLTLGGRWSVPLAWMLPAARQSSAYARRAVA
jgi:lipopolysaccharide/colanic/teichoic acid biosynthesis glycosyltransferase